MDAIFNVFFTHADTFQGLLVDTVIFFGVCHATISMLGLILSLANFRRI